MNWVIIIFIAIVVLVFIISKIAGVKQNIFAFIIITLILFSFLSFSLAFKGKDISINSLGDLQEAGVIYLAWVGNAFDNVKIITTQAIKLDWQANNTKKTS